MPESKPVAELSVAAVGKILNQRVRQLADERVPLAEAFGRILREPITADADQPPFDRSAVDGYALVPGPVGTQYRLIGTVKAGEMARRAPRPGEALRIFTGALVPARNLAVLMQEDAVWENSHLVARRQLSTGENIRWRGTDARKHEKLLETGHYLGAIELGLLASVGQTQPRVAPAPRIAHATTGDEIVPAESRPGPGQIRNSNQALIAGLLQAAHVPAANLHHEHWGDHPAKAARRLAAKPFATADLLLISGGASVGEHDYTARLLEHAGFKLLVRKVHMRPGRPLLVGFRGRQIAFGLPGNPVSHFVCFQLFVGHVLRRMGGFGPLPVQQWPLLKTLAGCANPRPTYWPAKLAYDQAGRRAAVEILPWNNSGHLAALVEATLLALVPANTKTLPAGARVDTFILRTRA